MKKALTLITCMLLVLLTGVCVASSIEAYDYIKPEGFRIEYDYEGRVKVGVFYETDDGRVYITNRMTSYDKESQCVFNILMKFPNIRVQYYENKNPVREIFYKMFGKTPDKIRLGG